MADFVIVGGGVYGCGVAWELARRGAEVVLLEADQIAGGASGGLGKRGVRGNGRDLRELPLMRLAYEQWPTLDEQIGAATGYERQGHLLLLERPLDLTTAPAQIWAQNQQGILSRLVEADELHEMEPHLSQKVLAAIYCPQDGVADHTATTQGLARAAQKLGVVLREQTAVAHLERYGERVTAVVTSQDERIPVGRTVLLLANSFVLGFVQAELGLTLPVWWMLPQVMLTEPLAPVPVRHLIGHAHRVLALKKHPTGQIMISGGWHGQWNEALRRGETRPDQVVGNFAEAVAVYPELADVVIAEADASRPETVSYDGLPIIDRLPGANNLIVGTGWSGHGWAISPAVSQLLAEWALTGQRDERLRPFVYARFGVGATAVG